jgi:hypothetical protein
MKKVLLQLLAMLLLLATIKDAHGQTQTIFNFGSSWKYLDNGSNQGTSWSAISFNDASWATGTGYFGYGDSWINTCVNACGIVNCNPTCATKYVTTYFRKTINIADTALYDSIKLSMYRDDGAVVYVNGIEVWRDNMPSGTILYNTLANSPAVGGADETNAFTKTIPMSAFVNGNNVIAVELHQQAASSSDMTFNMQAIGVIRTNIFSYGSAWKYLATSTDQGSAWRGTTYNDASWGTGTGHIGYGETWTTTCIPAGPSGCTAGCLPGSCTKYTTTYFRKTINLSDLTVFDSMRFSVFRDDGIVVYVNGSEVWRDNLPTGTISYATFAPNNVNGTSGTYAESLAVVKSIPISAFTTGSNTIAIELHQNSATSSDLDLNVKLTGVLKVPVTPVTLSQGPYLNMGNQTAVSVRWRTNIASKSRVMLGTTYGTYPIVFNDATALAEHELRATGLTPDTKYYYRIGTDTSIIQGDTMNFFVTAPADTSTRRVTIAVFGDCGRNDNGFQTGALSAYQNYLSSQGMKAADIMQLVGDNAYNAGTDAEFTTGFFAPYSGSVLKNHMLFPLPGNHDYSNGSAARQADHNVPYYSLFTLPSAGECGGVASGTEAYYSYDWGANVHVLSLDSYGKEDAGTTRLYDTNGAQVNWIKADLAANTKKWVIVLFHHPPYTMGSHNSNTEGELASIRQNFIRILERYGVDLVVCGHSHDYERSYLLKGHYGTEGSFSKPVHTADSSSAKYNGTANSCPYTYPSGKVNHGSVYVVSGSAGADGGIQSGYPHDALPFAIDDGGMFFIDIKDNRLDAKFLRRNNTVADQFTIMKDVKVQDTLSILYGQTATLTATWLGGYAWNSGASSRSITVTADVDTMITVKDSLTNTCIIDKHYIDVQCTMPAFTSRPSDIARSGCDNIITYSVADTARPNPTLTYTFTGATTASGSGTGSGSTFNVGVTNVTITATNTCGSANCNFTITVNPLPATVMVTGGGDACGNTVLNASNGGDGTIYFQGTTTDGTSTAIASSSQLISTSGMYYFRALGTDGCWSSDVGTAVTVHAIPAATTVSGGGVFCGNASLSATNGGDGIMYFQGTTSGGTSTAMPSASFAATSTATYYFRARSTAGCWSNEGSVTVTINPLPTAFAVSGGGSYCAGGAGVPVGISNTQSGVSYQLYNGASAVGTPIAGTGTALVFGAMTATGTYTVSAINTTTTCSNNMSSNASVAINPLPSVYAITGGGGYCAGGSGVHIGLGGSSTGISYKLFNGTSAVATLAGTGVPLDFGSLTAGGTYSILATNTATSCTNNMMGSAAIAITPLVTPSVSVSSALGTQVCAGTPVNFSATIANGGTTPSYQWRVNGVPVATTSSYTFTPSNGNIVSVKLTSNAACATPDTAISTLTMAVDPYVMPNATIAAVPGNILCEGSPVTFTSFPINGGTAPVYTWIKNSAVVGTSSTYSCVPTNGDEVILSMTSNKPCRLATTVYSNNIKMDIAERHLAAVSLKADPGTIIEPGTPVTITASITGGGPNPTYKWAKNNTIITGETSAKYTSSNFDNNDSVTCIVTGSGMCGMPNFNSVIIKTNTLGIEPTDLPGGFTVQPNPNGGEFYVKGVVANEEELIMSVTNILGQNVHLEKVKTFNGILDMRISLDNRLTGGLYILSIHSTSGTQTFRITVSR